MAGGTNIQRSAVQDFLSRSEGSPVKVLEFEVLGSGWHGTGCKITYRVRGKTKRAVLRTLSPVSFSHDYPSDRAQVFLLQDRLANRTPCHVRSVGVGGYTSSGKLISMGGAEDFFQIVEVASGVPYVNDLSRIERDGRCEARDEKRVKLLSDYLVKLHRSEFKGPADRKRSIRLRHLRDAVGHGEMLMGVLDTYPEKLRWPDSGLIAEVLSRAVRYAVKIRDVDLPLVRMHGDYHPGNIWFASPSKFTLLDASREEHGLAADDLTALSINYIWYALKTTGGFKGPFSELFIRFWENYLERTGDRSALIAAPLFFAFRAAVVAHPVFYPDQSPATRKKIFDFILNVLGGDGLRLDRIASYVKGD